MNLICPKEKKEANMSGNTHGNGERQNEAEKEGKKLTGNGPSLHFNHVTAQLT